MEISPSLYPRHQGLGGSDVAAAFGLSPFKSPVQLWAEKRQLLKHQADPQGLHLRLGHHLEPFIAKEFERDTGLITHHHLQAFVHPDFPMFFGHIDRFITEPGRTHRVRAGYGCRTAWQSGTYLL